MAFHLTSYAIQGGATFPTAYTCDGDNVSPPIGWSDLPEGTQSLVLILDDPDAPSGLFTHWLVYNIAPSVQQLGASQPSDETLENGAAQGVNSFGNMGYGGPCPPRGEEHNYYFRLYALDNQPDLATGAGREAVFSAMRDHILGTAEMIARYSRGNA